jgi:hypothetical protein
MTQDMGLEDGLDHEHGSALASVIRPHWHLKAPRGVTDGELEKVICILPLRHP